MFFKPLLLLFLPGTILAQYAKVRTLNVTESDVRLNVNSLFDEAFKEGVHNPKLPLFAKEKLQSIHTRLSNSTIDTIVSITNIDTRKDGLRLMITEWFEKRNPRIVVNGTLFWMLANDKNKAEDSYRILVNMFILSLIHEAAHLEHYTQKVSKEKGSKDQSLKEEARTLLEVDIKAVRPMLRRGMPLHPMFQNLDSVIKRCHDKVTCPLYLEYITSHHLQ